jgi:HPt (histidine-containing phosphotransfer) domain-containing protein
LVELFMTQSTKQLDRLEGAVATGDATAVTEVAHNLRGSSGNLGAQRMAELCRQVERAAQRSDVSGAAPLVPRLQTEFARVRAALSAQLSGPALESRSP